MKIALVLVSAFMLANGCKTQQQVSNETSETSENTEQENTMEDNVIITLNKNSSYEIMNDEFGNSYINKKEGDMYVFEYKITKSAPEGVADGIYSESIMFQFKEDMLPLSLTNEDLSNVNLVTSKLCKCRDGGFFKVTNGNLSASKTGNDLVVAINFNVEGLNQELNVINTSVEF
ncbi:hypothetical protein ACFQO1_02705 [Jejudonia soesokkakensis]|uniref:Lipoprotein n=1 Tax=Jejudonia soesokkakensis TaxID=1323432 RepID=A0ABW2MTF9_9FLAO